mgnify:FL=1
MSTDKKVIDKLQKLLALAEQGVGSEKETAQRMLDKMLNKHGLTEADISDAATDVYWFIYKGAIEKALLYQLMYAVAPESNRYRKKGSKTTTGVECTKREMLDIELRFSLYREAIKKDIELLINAFILKNDIYPESEDYVVRKEFTPEEKAERFRTAQLAAGLEKTNVLKSIENKA